MNFQTRSYFEGIWNAIKGVEYTPRDWDLYDVDETIIIILLKFLPKAYRSLHDDAPHKKEYKRLLLLLLIYKYIDLDFERQEKIRKEIGELIGKNFFSFWI